MTDEELNEVMDACGEHVPAMASILKSVLVDVLPADKEPGAREVIIAVGMAMAVILATIGFRVYAEKSDYKTTMRATMLTLIKLSKRARVEIITDPEEMKQVAALIEAKNSGRVH